MRLLDAIRDARLFAHPFSDESWGAWRVIGRRGGKSQIAALIAVYLAAFRDYSEVLAAGERGTLMVIAADRRQARTVLRYINGLLDSVPMLAKMVRKRTAESIELSNRISIEVHTANFRAVRGYTLIGARSRSGMTTPAPIPTSRSSPHCGPGWRPFRVRSCSGSPRPTRGAECFGSSTSNTSDATRAAS